jgi:PAS domain S-box-containing protein
MDTPETALRRARRPTMGDHFSDAVAAIRQPFVVYDAEERLAAFNAAFSDLHREPDGIPVLRVGMSFQELMEWRMRTGFFAAGSSGRADPAHAEYRLAKGDVVYQLHDGRWMFVDNCCLPDGRLACTWSDITAVKEAERQLWQVSESLRQSQDHLLRAQRIAHVGSIERDLRTDTLRWTAEMYQIFGRDPDLPPPTREQVLDLLHPEDRPHYQEKLRTSERGLATAPSEFRIVRPDGMVRWIYHESEVFFDEAHQPSLRVATYKDVTEIHAYQEQEHALQAELLAKERLSAIGEVAATVTHELRNPLSTIRNTLCLIREAAGASAVPSQRQLDRIERSIDRCNRITADLLEFSRLGPMRSRACELDAWLREFAAEAPGQGEVPLILDLRAPGVLVALDRSRFRRALGHLVNNAVQALAEASAPIAEPRILLRTRRRGRQVECVVEDNGPGMTAADLARAFDPLFSTKMFGTGLGLPIVKQTIEQHGGDIVLSSILGAGTLVRIYLPVTEKAAVDRSDSTLSHTRAA